MAGNPAETTEEAMTKFLTTITPNAFRALQTSKLGTRVVPVDATWFMPNAGKAGFDEYKQLRIPGAVFFDMDAVSTPLQYPHMLPLYATFNEGVLKLGLDPEDKLVVYDKQGIFSAPRVAWTLALFGHRKVYVLDNYFLYVKSGYPVDQNKVTTPTPKPENTSGYQAVSEAEFKENYKREVIEYDELLELVKDGAIGRDYVLFDARPRERFDGSVAEPRAGLKLGHIPGSTLVPFPTVLTADKNFKLKAELQKVFGDAGFDTLLALAFLDGKKGVIVSCGSGTTAVVLRFAIQQVLGLNVSIRVYDGSWSEWGHRAPEEYVEKL